jgi:hypothetical protein
LEFLTGYARQFVSDRLDYLLEQGDLDEVIRKLKAGY